MNCFAQAQEIRCVRKNVFRFYMNVGLRDVYIYFFCSRVLKKIELACPTTLFRWRLVSVHTGDTNRSYLNKQLADTRTDMLCTVVLCADAESKSDNCCTTNP